MKDIDLSQISPQINVKLIISNVVGNPKLQEILMQNLGTNNQGRYNWQVYLDDFKKLIADILGLKNQPQYSIYSE